MNVRIVSVLLLMLNATSCADWNAVYTEKTCPSGLTFYSSPCYMPTWPVHEPMRITHVLGDRK